MVELNNLGGEQVRNSQVFFLELWVVTVLAQLAAAKLLERCAMVLHAGHLEARVVTSDFSENYFVENQIGDNSSSSVNGSHLA